MGGLSAMRRAFGGHRANRPDRTSGGARSSQRGGGPSRPLRRAFLALLALALASPQLQAETIRVRSGDHPTFSRLVFLLAPLPTWELREEGERRLRLSIEGSHDLILDDVFRFITRDRIAALRQTGPGEVEIRMACDCRTRSFPVKAGLVVDITDQPAPPPPRPPASSSEARPPALLPGDPLALWRKMTQMAAGKDAAAGLASKMLGTPAATASENSELLGGPAKDEWREMAEAAHSLQDMLLRHLARSASQGLVELRPRSPAQGQGSAVPTQAVELRRSPASPSPPSLRSPPARAPGSTSHGVDGQTNIKVQSVMDEWAMSRAREQAAADDGSACLAPDLTDVNAWGEDGGQPDLALHRAAVFDALDRPAAEAVLKRARYLVFLGFGAEALVLLDAFEQQGTVEGKVLGELARIIDEMPDGLAGVFDGQQSCPQRAALWAYLAAPPGQARDVNVSALATAVSELPPHLRRLLGPRVARRLQDDKMPAAAAMIRSIYERSIGPPNPAMRLVAASIAMEEGDAAAMETLLELRSGQGREAAQALLILLEAELRAGRSPSPDLIEEIGVKAVELQGSDLGAEMAQAHVRALIAAERLPEALDRLLRAGAAHIAGAGQEAWTELATSAIARSVEAGPPAILLPRLLRLATLLPQRKDAEDALLSLAATLTETGLPGLALEILEPLGGEEEVIVIERARALLALGDLDSALRAIDTLDTPEAERLRGEILLRPDRGRETVPLPDDARVRDHGSNAGSAFPLGADGPVVSGASGEKAGTAGEEPSVADGTATPGGGATDGHSLRKSRAMIEESTRLRASLATLLGGGG